ncbi:MAG: septum formation initiator family protein [Bacteroidales bacterium]
MNENKKGEKKIHKGVSDKFLCIIASIIFFVIIVFLDSNNIIRWSSEIMHVHNQEKTIQEYKRKIKETDAKLESLTNNKDSLEKFAREKYFYHKKNEEIFIVE